MATKEKILVVDDELSVCRSVAKILTKRGYYVDYTLTGESAMDKIEEVPYNLVILDIMMPNIGGIDLLTMIREQYGECSVMMITGYPSILTAVEAMRRGAEDYVVKPFTADEIADVVKRILVANPRSELFCEKGRRICKRYAKSGVCEDECLILKKQEILRSKKAEEVEEVKVPAGFTGEETKEIIDVDLPFDYDEVERATSEVYPQIMSRSDIPIIGLQKYCRRNNRVLVIDDETVVCNSVRKILSGSGYQVDYAVNGTSAIDMLQWQNYALVLLDLKLPDVPGMDLLRKIRSRWPDVRIVVITGYASIDNALEAIKLGATNYIPKPFEAKELIAAAEVATERIAA